MANEKKKCGGRVEEAKRLCTIVCLWLPPSFAPELSPIVFSRWIFSPGCIPEPLNLFTFPSHPQALNLRGRTSRLPSPLPGKKPSLQKRKQKNSPIFHCTGTSTLLNPVFPSIPFLKNSYFRFMSRDDSRVRNQSKASRQSVTI